MFGLDELPLPAQRGTEVFALSIETIGIEIEHHMAPPIPPPASVHFRMARFTATLASVILYLL